LQTGRFVFELAALVRDLKQQIASFKVPKDLLVVESLPGNLMRKVLKNVLRDTYA
jgi:acyl-coenzyme A synthetase/AMP-(fatty) acid ligase